MLQLSASAQGVSSRARPVPVACQQRGSPARGAAPPAAPASASRRESMAGLLALTGGLLLQGQLPQQAGAAAGPAPVGTYMPKDETNPGFVRYVPDARKTPAIRAGVIKPEPEYYSFSMPESWSEGLLSNVLTGNFCMPRCDEPWVECLYSDPKEGRVQLVVSPLFRLVNKTNPTLAEVGTAEGVVESVGPFITGTYLDVEDVLSAEVGKLADGRDAYLYEINAFYAQNGNHSLAAFTTKGDLAYLLVTSATDKQWATSQDKLRTIIKSFKP